MVALRAETAPRCESADQALAPCNGHRVRVFEPCEGVISALLCFKCGRCLLVLKHPIDFINLQALVPK